MRGAGLHQAEGGGLNGTRRARSGAAFCLSGRSSAVGGSTVEWCKLSLLVADTVGALIGVVATLVWFVPVWKKAAAVDLDARRERLPPDDRTVIHTARDVAAGLYTTAERGEIGPLRVGLALLVVAFLLSVSSKIAALVGGPTCSQAVRRTLRLGAGCGINLETRQSRVINPRRAVGSETTVGAAIGFSEPRLYRRADATSPRLYVEGRKSRYFVAS